MTLRNIFILLILTFSNLVNGQTFDRIYQGLWAHTCWTFEFKSDGTYKSTTAGHFGDSKATGKYEIKEDSIVLLIGFDSIRGAVNETYFLDKDSMLIDLDTRYDYAIVSKPGQNFYNSQNRLVKYPQTTTDNESLKSELENVLNRAFNSSTVKQYYHFDKLPQRQFLFADYYNLKVNIQVDSIKSVFKPLENITENFYIEFENINCNSVKISFRINIHGEGVGFQFNYLKKDGQWVAEEPSEFEK